MGQRMQYYVFYPGKYLNENNPNNFDDGMVIIHNQWSYGTGAILRLSKFVKHFTDVIELRNEKIKTNTSMFKNLNWREIIKNVVSKINVEETYKLVYPERNEVVLDTNSSDKETLETVISKDHLLDMMEYWDNNNGYVFIEITNKFRLKYAIMNGSEDADVKMDRTITGYINLFLRDKKKLKELFGDEEFIEVMDTIQRNAVNVDCDYFMDKYKKINEKILEKETVK